MLFNITIEATDVAQLIYDLENTTLQDISAENAIINSIYGAQIEQKNMLDVAELYTEEIFQFSSNSISLHRKFLESTLQPTIFANEIDLGRYGLDNTSGLITGGTADTVFSPYYWKIGDSVIIQNDAFSADGIIANIDILMTREASQSSFLLDVPYEPFIA